MKDPSYVSRAWRRIKTAWLRRLATSGKAESIAEGMIAPPVTAETILFAPEHVAAEHRSDLLMEAEEALQHRWHFFDLDGTPEPEINWCRDSRSGRVAPLIFSPDIDVRDLNCVGDIKVIWEKNRHHHLTVMAAAYALTLREEFARETADQILHWIQKNPYMMGPNWISLLECSIRLISWTWCERLLRASPEHKRVFGAGSPFWKSAELHQCHIARNLSRGPLATNHLIGELAGLFITSSVWPYFRKSPDWQAMSAEGLADELTKQFFASGINKELAFSYHLFVTEFYLLALYEARTCTYTFPEAFHERVRRMVEVIPQLSDRNGNLPRYGDEDDGRALRMDADRSARLPWLYRLAGELVSARVPVTADSSVSTVLMDLERTAGHEDFKSEQSISDAGLYTLTSKWRKDDEVFLLVKAGPMGYLSAAAHGHADCLSFVLSVNGIRIFVDTGTYSYYGDTGWRAYFQSTAAHSTIEIDGESQSVAEGVFQWGHKAMGRLVEYSPGSVGGKLVVEHDGYSRLQDPVHHRRQFELNDTLLAITDSLTGNGRHRISCRFHLDPECCCRLDGNTATIASHRASLLVELDPTLEWTSVRGGEGAGWFSPGFGRKKQTHSIVGTADRQCPVRIRTGIRIEHIRSPVSKMD